MFIQSNRFLAIGKSNHLNKGKAPKALFGGRELNGMKWIFL